MTKLEQMQERLANETAKSATSRLVHKLQIETTSTKGQSIEYRKGLRDMRYLVMEHAEQLIAIDIQTALTQVWNEAVEETKIKNKETIEYYQLRARNEAIKECEGCEKAAPDSWEYNGPFWFVQDGERISEKYSDELEMYKDLWRFMYGLPTIKPLLPRTNITSDK